VLERHRKSILHEQKRRMQLNDGGAVAPPSAQYAAGLSESYGVNGDSTSNGANLSASAVSFSPLQDSATLDDGIHEEGMPRKALDPPEFVRPQLTASSGSVASNAKGMGGASRDNAVYTRATEPTSALQEELYAVYPPYVDLDRIEAAVRGEEVGLRAQLDAMRADREEARQEWMDLRQRGTLWLVVAYLTQQWLDALRRGHMWGSIFFTPQEDLLVVTRP